MRSSLAEIDTVSEVNTNCAERECSFTADLDKVDVGIQLHELANSNDKLKGWKLVSLSTIAAEEDADSAAEAAAESDAAEGDAEEPDASDDSVEEPAGEEVTEGDA